jgi:colicin import membrane protein
MRADALGRSFTVSVLLHAVLFIVLFFAAREVPVTEPAPVSVELWSAPPPSPAAVVPVVRTPPVVPAPTPEPMSEPEVPKADIRLGKKPEMKKREASAPRHEKPRPEKPVPVQPAPKPAPSPKKAAPDKPVVEARPAGKGKKAAAHYNDLSNDLLADLGSTNTTRAPNSRTTQAGAANGVVGGVAGGSSQARDNYAAKVRAKILPLVQLPPGMQGNPTAVVQVALFPTLEVRSVKLLQSSGNPAYDEAVQRAIMEAKTFPSLPSGTRFGDVRQLRLEFRPH